MSPGSKRRRLLYWIVGAVAAVAIIGSVAFRRATAPDLDRLWESAEAEYRAGRLDQAEKKLNLLDRARPPTAESNRLRAFVAWGLHKPVEALAALERIDDAQPSAARAWLLRGQIERDLGRANDAEQSYLHSLKLDPRLVQSRRELIYIYGLQLRRHELQEQFRLLSESTGLPPPELLNWAATRGDIRQPTEALDSLERFVKTDPNDRRSRIAWAETLRSAGRLDEALAAVAPLPDSEPDARAVRTRLALDRGELAEAEKLLAKGPVDHLELARARGKLALARGDWNAAVAHYRAAIAAEPTDRESLAGLGLALKRLGKTADAQPFLDRASAQDRLTTLINHAAAVGKANADPTLERRLGDACANADRLFEAVAWYKLAILRDPLDSAAQTGLHRAQTRLGTQSDSP